MQGTVRTHGHRVTPDLGKLVALMRAAGSGRIYAKKLAPNDNSKNQVYFGPGFESLNLFPTQGIVPDHSGSNPIFKAALNFAWLQDDGRLFQAPGAQLILYPQYPEVRLSGFLRNARGAPSALMAARTPGRMLLLGISKEGKIIAYATGPDDPATKQLEALSGLPAAGVFYELKLAEVEDSRSALLQELRRVHSLGWINSKRLLAPDIFGPCESPNCGGYTLEAELGILPNGFSEPDFRGWEIKQHGVKDFTRLSAGVLTLMTPEPTGGFYRDAGPEAFVRRFGYEDRRGKVDRLNFGGIHRAGVKHEGTHLTLQLIGYDAQRGKVTDPSSGGIALVGPSDTIAAMWHFKDLMLHWTRKHARAAYVPSKKRESPTRQYKYGPQIRLAEGTDFLAFLAAVMSGAVYYDPGIKIEGASTRRPKLKRRSQFRIRSKNLSTLYHRMETVSVT